jgi:hypothetical protein
MKQDLNELTQNELLNINGGTFLENALYYIGDKIGLFAGAIYNAAHFDPLSGFKENSFSLTR